MFKHILIPTDRCDRADRAVDVATELAAPTGATVTLFHVIQTIQGVEFQEMESFYAELVSRVRQRLAALVARHSAAGMVARMEVAYGAPATEILWVSQEHAIDLVVLASHPIDRDNPASGWGTLSYKVGLLVACPVLLVKWDPRVTGPLILPQSEDENPSVSPRWPWSLPPLSPACSELGLFVDLSTAI